MDTMTFSKISMDSHHSQDKGSSLDKSSLFHKTECSLWDTIPLPCIKVLKVLYDYWAGQIAQSVNYLALQA